MADINDMLFKLLLTEINEMDPIQRAGYYSVITEFAVYVQNNNLIEGGKRTKNKKIKKTKRRKNKKTKRGGRYSDYPNSRDSTALQNAQMALDRMENEERTQPGSYWGVYNTPTQYAATIRTLREELLASVNGSDEQTFVIRRIAHLYELLKSAQDNAIALQRFRTGSLASTGSLAVGAFISAYTTSAIRQYEDERTLSYMRDKFIDGLTWTMFCIPDIFADKIIGTKFGTSDWATHWVEGRRVGFNHLVMLGSLPAVWKLINTVGEQLFFTEITAVNINEKLLEFNAVLEREQGLMSEATTRSVAAAKRSADQTDDKINVGFTLAALATATAAGLPQAAGRFALRNTPESLAEPIALTASRAVVSRIPGLTEEQQSYTTQKLSKELQDKRTSAINALKSVVPPEMQQQLDMRVSYEKDIHRRVAMCLESFKREGGRIDDTVAAKAYLDTHLHEYAPQGFAQAQRPGLPPQGFGQYQAIDPLDYASAVDVSENVERNLQRYIRNPEMVESKRAAFDLLSRDESWQWICHACNRRNNQNNPTCQGCGASVLDSNSIHVPDTERPGPGRTLTL